MVAGGGGGTENSALSCVSVSRINEVMSWFLNRAFVNILGGGKLFLTVSFNGIVFNPNKLTEDCQCPGKI